MVKKKIFVTKDVDDLIAILKQAALKKQINTEKKLRELLENLDWQTFLILTKVIAEYAEKYKLK